MRNDLVSAAARPAALALAGALLWCGAARAESPLDELALDVLDTRESPEQGLERVSKERRRGLGQSLESVERGLLQRLLDDPGVDVGLVRDAPRELVTALPDVADAFGGDDERGDDGEDGWGDRDDDDDDGDDDSGEGGGGDGDD